MYRLELGNGNYPRKARHLNLFVDGEQVLKDYPTAGAGTYGDVLLKHTDADAESWAFDTGRVIVGRTWFVYTCGDKKAEFFVTNTPEGIDGNEATEDLVSRIIQALTDTDLENNPCENFQPDDDIRLEVTFRLKHPPVMFEATKAFIQAFTAFYGIAAERVKQLDFYLDEWDGTNDVVIFYRHNHV